MNERLAQDQIAALGNRELNRTLNKEAEKIAGIIVKNRKNENKMQLPAQIPAAVQPKKTIQEIAEDMRRKYGLRMPGTDPEETGADAGTQAGAPAASGSADGLPATGRNGRTETAAQGRTEGTPESEKRNPTRKENEFMLNLMILRNTLALHAPACRERALKAGRWTWRNIRLMLTLVNKVQDDMIRTMPARRNEYYSAYAEHGHYELVMNGPKRPSRFVLISDRHLAALCEAAMESECIMCMRQGTEISRCPLRAALLEVAPPSELQDGRWIRCEYREAAGNLIRDEDITL